MTLQLLVNNQDVAPLLTGPPKISDQLDAVCRQLDFTLQAADGLANYLGQAVQLYLGGQRWYYGFLEVRGREANGQITYKVYDPLYFLKKNPQDYYFKGVTADQLAREVCSAVGVKVGRTVSTGYTMQPRLYQKAEGDKVIAEALQITQQEVDRAYWYRFNPEDGPDFGLNLYEQVVPATAWAFQRGVNLTNAKYEESLEDHYNIVRLVNRETGKEVIKVDSRAVLDFGARTHFEEVDQDAAATMDQDAAALLDEKNKVKVTISLEGINAGLVMPQFFSGDVIYVEEDITGELGAYYVKNVTQTILDSKNVQLAFDVETEPATKRVKVKPPAKQKPKDESAGTPGSYSPEMQALIDKYGLSKEGGG